MKVFKFRVVNASERCLGFCLFQTVTVLCSMSIHLTTCLRWDFATIFTGGPPPYQEVVSDNLRNSLEL